MLLTNFIPDISLAGLYLYAHQLLASRTIDLMALVQPRTDFGITRINRFRHPLAAQGFDLTRIEPDPLAVEATVNLELLAVGDFFHLAMALRTVNQGHSLLSNLAPYSSIGTELLTELQDQRGLDVRIAFFELMV